MSGDELAVLQRFPNRIEAEMAKGALEMANIDSLVSGDDAGGVEPGLWMQGIRLLVRATDLAQAREVLRQLEQDPDEPSSA
jgi:hypothetical protein